MQLNVARLCLDCQEIHEGAACPACGSESFAYITRWIPAADRQVSARPAPPPNDVETYRQLLAADAGQPKNNRWLKRGALVAAVSVAGWLWRRGPDNAPARNRPADAPPQTRRPPAP
jgi:hypothetical protein